MPLRTGYGGFEGSPLDPGSPSAASWSAPRTGWLMPPHRGGGRLLRPQPLFNPLYVHGNVGLGKTHLLHAISWDVKQRKPEAQLLYLTAERFMSSFVQALRARDALAFKEKLREIDILLIDDMEFLQGPTIQQEFCHTLNSLIDGGRQVVVAADCAPTQLESSTCPCARGSREVWLPRSARWTMTCATRSWKRRGRRMSDTRGLDIPEQVIEFLA